MKDLKMQDVCIIVENLQVDSEIIYALTETAQDAFASAQTPPADFDMALFGLAKLSMSLKEKLKALNSILYKQLRKEL